MTPERWKAIEALFDECLALGPAERRSRLETRGRSDPELVGEVEALLAEAERTDRLHGLVEEPARQALESLAELGPGDRVGAYRLESLLGEGGMGKVFLARRDDDEFQQRVAVKLLPPGAAARGLEARFRTERQILAGLEHPHIARLLDGGATEDGRPFLVMEHVEGERLTDSCDRRQLTVRDRLELFLQVASALEHAHRHLVVHRDVKPANILVHPETGPKLLDFGIAKILQPSEESVLASAPLDLTEPQERLLTPDYASPEQILGEPVTTQSDVYSLGVLLFELLTGDRPRHLQALTSADRIREVTRTVVPRPSTRVRRAPTGGGEGDVEAGHSARCRGVSPQQLRRQLEGDLDTIVLRALDSDPARRYGSVGELAADVGRFLRGEPVLARSDSLRYRAGKWIRRHPWGSAALASIVALAASLGAGLVLHVTRIGQERDRALAAEVEAETVSEFLLTLFEVADPAESRGETVTARELLERGGEMIETQLSDQPAVRATLLSTLAEVHRSLGLWNRAETLHRLALERRLELFGEAHPDTAESRDLLGDTLRNLARLDEAEAQLRLALATREEVLPADDPGLADSLNNLGLLLLERQRYEEAEPLLRRGLSIRRRILGPDHPDTDVSRSNLGQLLSDTRHFEEAARHLETTLENRRARMGENHPKVANSLHVLATLRHRQGDLVAAEALFEESLRIHRRILPPDHPLLAVSLNNLASLLHDQWRLGEAEMYYREALRTHQKKGGGDVLGRAYALNNLGSLLEDLGRYEEAEALYVESLALRRETQGEDSRSYRRMLSSLGRLAIRRGRLELAEERLDEARAWIERHLDRDEPDAIRTVERLALLRRAQGNAEAAAALYREALDRAGRSYGGDHPILAELRAELAITLSGSAEPSSCRGTVAAAEEVLDRIEASPITRGRVALAAGLCGRATGDSTAATASLQAAVELLRPYLGDGNHWVRAARTH